MGLGSAEGIFSTAAPNLSSFWSSSFNRESTSWSQSSLRAHMCTSLARWGGHGLMRWCKVCFDASTPRHSEGEWSITNIKNKLTSKILKESLHPKRSPRREEHEKICLACSSSSSFSGTSVRSGEGEVVSAVSERSRRSHSSRSSQEMQRCCSYAFSETQGFVSFIFHSYPFPSVPIILPVSLQSFPFKKLQHSKTSSSGGELGLSAAAAAAAAAATAASSSAFVGTKGSSNTVSTYIMFASTKPTHIMELGSAIADRMCVNLNRTTWVPLRIVHELNSTSKWGVSYCWLHNSICITFTALCPWPVALPPPQPSALLLLALYPTSYQAAWIKEGLTSNHSQKNSQNAAASET